MTSFAVRRVRLALVAGAMLLLAAVPALAAPGKQYTVDLAGTAIAGRDVAFTATFAVAATQQQQLGSADLTVPAGFVPRAAEIDGQGDATVSGRAVQLRNLALQPGQSVDVRVTASVACRSGDARWTVVGKQANDFKGQPGNNLALDANSLLNTPIVGQCVPCEEDAVCENSAATGRSNLTLKGQPHAGIDAGRLSLAFDLGPQLDCDDYQERTAGTALFDVTGGRAKTMLLRVDSLDLGRRGASALEVCFGNPDEAFPTSTGETATVQGSYDFDGDGTPDPMFVGLLPSCNQFDPPCVRRRWQLDGDGIIEASLPPGDPAARG